MAQTVSTLANELGVLGMAYDEEGNLLEESINRAEEYIEAKGKQAENNAMIERQNELEMERASIEANLAEIEAKRTAIENDQTLSGHERWTLLNDLKDVEKEYGELQADNAYSIEANNQVIADSYDATADETVNSIEAINGATDKNGNNVKNLALQYGTSVEQIVEEASKMEGGLAEWSERQAELFTQSGMDLDMVAERWGMTAEEVQARMEEWGMNLDAFHEHMKETHTDEGLSIEELAVKWGTTVEAIQEAMSMEEISMQEWSDNQDAAWQGFQDSITGHKDSIINSFKEIPAEYEMSAEDMIRILNENREKYATWQQNMTEISKYLSDEALAELEKLGPGANSAIEEMLANGGEMAKQYNEEIAGIMGEATDQAVAEMNDPKLKEAGGAGNQQIGVGFTESTATKDAVETVMSEAEDAAFTAASSNSGVNAGHDIAAGLAQGVRAGMGILAAAVQEIIRKGLEAGKRQAEIASPSKLFKREIGLLLAEGVATGVDAGTPMVEHSVEEQIQAAADTLKGVNVNNIVPMGTLDTLNINAMTEHAGLSAQNKILAEQLETMKGLLHKDWGVRVDGRQIAMAVNRANKNMGFRVCKGAFADEY
jgi:hypothetical protein